MNKPKCLLIHVPKKHNYYPPLNHYSSIHWMAHGIFALADALNHSGYPTRILHLGIERILNPSFELFQESAMDGVWAVGFSLQFHQQLTDTLAEAEKLKRNRPNSFIFLGGMTASFFAEELLQNYPGIDAIICGEGENPSVQLVNRLQSGSKDLSGIPNLIWRRNGQVITNPEIYSASEEDLDQWSFANLTYLQHHGWYLNFPKIIFHTRLSGKWNVRLAQILQSEKKNFFPGLIIGRGCFCNCFYCGGGNHAQKLVNHRHSVIFRSPEKVIDDICLLKSFGYEGSYISFDPQPMSQNYYMELFQLLRQKKITFDIIFSAWGLPSKAFLREFSLTFGEKSSISISPETGSERLRRLVREPFFSNQQLLDTLDFCEKWNIRTSIFFSLGIPHETQEDFQQTLALRRCIQSRFKKAAVKAFVIEIEPASPWHLHSEKYGIHLRRKNLQDFLADQNRPDYSSMRCLGFTKGDLLGKKLADEQRFEGKLLKVKCRHFCEQRYLCPFLTASWKIARFFHFTKPTQ